MNLPENMNLQATLEAGKIEAAKEAFLSNLVTWLGRISILSAILISPWLFGSVNYTPQFWIAAAALVGLAFWWFETALYKKEKQVLPYILVPITLGLLIALFQLVALPESMQDLLLGRQGELCERFTVDGQIIAEQVDASSVEKRISLNRDGTTHQIRLILIAIAGLLLGCRLFRTQKDMVVLLALVTANGVALSILGILQQLTSDKTMLYWTYELTQGGTPFASFVNRNNAAGYLLMCLAASIGLFGIFSTERRLAGPHLMVSKEIPFWRQVTTHILYFIADLTATKLATLLSIVVIAAGVMATLSRGGVLALLAGATMTIVFYGMARKPKHTGVLLVPLFALVMAFVSWVGFGDKLVDRLETLDTTRIATEELRLKNWTDTMPATREMGVFGSGLGSYAGVHRLYRTDREDRVFRFAENQYFQGWVEAGWPGLILYLIVWLIAWNYAMILIYRGTSPTTVWTGTAGVFLLTSQAVASFFDFGFYIPSNLLLLATLVGFLAYHAHSLASRLRKLTWLRFQMPNRYVQIALLLAFAGVTIAALDLYRKSQIEQAMAFDIQNATYKTLDLETTDGMLQTIAPMVRKTNSIEGLNYLGDLCVHRARLQYFDELMQLPAIKNLDEATRESTAEEFWRYTRLNRMHENLHFLGQQVSQYRAEKFLEYDFIASNLPLALTYYRMSRQISPLQPQVHKQIGKINALIGTNNGAAVDYERAIELAPTNSDLRLSAGLFYLQAGRVESGAVHLKRHLELTPDNFISLMRLLTGRSSRKINRVPEAVIFKTIIPDDPKMLFDFAVRFMDAESGDRLEVLNKAESVLGETSLSQIDDLLLNGEIRLAKDDLEGGIEMFELALRSDPSNLDAREKIARLYLRSGDLLKAREQSDYLIEINDRLARYKQLDRQVKKAIKLEKERTKQQQRP